MPLESPWPLWLKIYVFVMLGFTLAGSVALIWLTKP